MQDNELIKNLRNLIRPLFKEKDGFEIIPRFKSDDYYFDVNWLLNDPDRPNKRSKTIRIVIPKETIGNHFHKQPAIKTDIGNKLKKFIKQNLLIFNPDHNKKIYESPPIEEWIVKTELFR